MSNTLILFLSLAWVAACSRPSPSPQATCTGTQTNGKNCPPNKSSDADLTNERLKEAQRAAADASRREQETIQKYAACTSNPNAPGCTPTSQTACTANGQASVDGSSVCISLKGLPCTNVNLPIAGENSYCSPVGYQCSKNDTKITCAKSSSTGQTNTPNSWEALIQGLGSTFSNTAERNSIGKLIFSAVQNLFPSHGDKGLLISVNKNSQGIYALYLGARDPDVTNIKVRYLANEAFDGLKGPTIKAEISWEVRGRQCEGKETVFDLKTYSNPKPLNANCKDSTK